MDGSGCVSGDQSLRPLERCESGELPPIPEGRNGWVGVCFRGPIPSPARAMRERRTATNPIGKKWMGRGVFPGTNPFARSSDARAANCHQSQREEMDGSGCVFRGVVLEGPETWAFRRVVAVGPRLEGARREDKVFF